MRCAARLALIGALVSTGAWADAYDFQIYKLGSPQVGGTGYSPRANGNFRVFARQLGAAISSVNLMPPETLGHAGFAFSVETAIVFIEQDPTGVNGIGFPTQGLLTSPLRMPSVHIRKGLPFSFELGARIGWLEQSRMATGTVELKWAINEGFTYLPDIGVSARITKLINSRDFDLTVGGLDLGVGKQFALAGMLTLTPYVGWNLQFVGASTGPVDFNPSRSQFVAEQPDKQFQDIYIFDSMSAAANTHNRFYGGLRFISGSVMLAAEVSYSMIGKFNDQTTGMDRNVPGVVSVNLTVGLDF